MAVKGTLCMFKTNPFWMRFWLQIFKSRVYESTLLGLFCSNWVEGHSHASRVTSCGCIIYLWLGDLFVVLVDLYVLWWGGSKRRGRWKLGSIWVKQPRCVCSGGVRWLESFGREVMVITNQSLSPLSHGTRSVCMPSPKLRPLNNDTETIGFCPVPSTHLVTLGKVGGH